MEDGSVSDRLKKRFQLFGQFFKGFLKPEDVRRGIRADGQVYDDTTTFPENKVLEFRTGTGDDERRNIRETHPPFNRRPFTSDPDPVDFFGMTKGLLEEFEQTMKIFDDFAFIIQQPFPGENGEIGRGIDEASRDDADEQEARYFKFFKKGKGILDPTPPLLDTGESGGNPDENLRDRMLKPNGNEDKKRFERSELFGGHGAHSLLGRILGSLWDRNENDEILVDLEQSHGGERNLPGSGFGGSGSYFTFTTQESSLKSDGSNMSVTATKIRETPEGREVITYKTNEQGVLEETREFIPRKDLQNTPNPFLGIFPPRL